ncbi:helix-turn-helix transcriptional regulator [Martelella mediterranea]|uniref:Putative DNA-binding transcriptional regulator YafY n=1 Tax=Martelella mediterranea TaxID=293089 RepID=A0A4R3NHX0_9HYPH|nr:YafY family protein [Martelella mediterranea]TCT33090.1 putative DNA-binding transcriptional regulator YafY [Martelella mediterranea]
MSGTRSERLLALLQLLRGHRYPVSGEKLADLLNVSLRTLYRDIASLRAQGAAIEGEAGIGYVLRPGFLLPPMMFSAEEIEALVLGSRWVERSTDEKLSAAASQALTKIASILPEHLSDMLDQTALIIGPRDIAPETADIGVLRGAIRDSLKVELDYRDENARASRRVIWPIGLAYFERVRVVVAWCEMRDGFRHFRTDRIAGLTVSDQRYPERRSVLLHNWRKTLP